MVNNIFAHIIQEGTTLRDGFLQTWPCGLLKFEACCDEMDARDLIKLKPEVNRVDEVQTYSLQSDAGNYECSVSGLRWVCKEEVSFKYKFLSWRNT
ncbi:NACHT LRR and PYD domains-containing protein 1 like [Dissostichus eleginoides]|uniref:NACHT LRR and PYD domains-containing protein 1 like n=1 Tax=Dissostichus eleginoides TaxID=100907 RepID=A0AAD9BTB1_DISEL|nr:NACHT LRR and PYD domains-containing protein 1 like [Dissostichus eleginoides]